MYSFFLFVFVVVVVVFYVVLGVGRYSMKLFLSAY